MSHDGRAATVQRPHTTPPESTHGRPTLAALAASVRPPWPAWAVSRGRQKRCCQTSHDDRRLCGDLNEERQLPQRWSVAQRLWLKATATETDAVERSTRT